jgi:hypothetical protein
VHRFYVGDFEELITDTRDTANAASQKSRIGASVLHLKRIDRSSLEYESIQYLHRIQVLIQRRFD